MVETKENKQYLIAHINKELKNSNVKRLVMDAKFYTTTDEYRIRSIYLQKGTFKLCHRGRKNNPLLNLNTLTLAEILRKIVNREYRKVF